MPSSSGQYIRSTRFKSAEVIIMTGKRKKFYKRGWHHTKTRGSENMVSCGFCGRRVPRYKTFTVVKGLRINDPLLRNQMGYGRRGLSLLQNKIHACPACARHRGIVRRKK